MNFSFPQIKTTRSFEEQLQKILDETIECLEAEGEEDKDEELVDTLHAIETAIRIRFKGREDVLNKIIKSVIKKNTTRGYYQNPCF